MTIVSGVRRMIFLLPAFIVCLLLTSCLDVHTDIRVKGSGSASAQLTYVLRSSIADFGRGFGSDEPWPFPLTEVDFQRRALETGGTEVTSYRVRSGPEGGDTIKIRLKSESIDALAAYLGLSVQMTVDGDSGSFVLTLPDAEPYASSGESSRSAIDALLEGTALHFSFRPPSKPVDTSSGEITGRAAEVSFELIDILYGRSPEEWTVRW